MSQNVDRPRIGRRDSASQRHRSNPMFTALQTAHPRTLFMTVIVTLAALAWGAPTGRELLEALRIGDTKLTKRLLTAGAPVNAIDEFGTSALMYAALYSDAGVVRVLLDRGANPNHSDECGATALMWAASDRAKGLLLLDRGADVNAAAKTGRTALLMSSGHPGSVAIVRMLLDKGADSKAADKQGRNVITSAAASGDPDIVKLLLDRGLDPNATAQIPFTPLFIAAVLNRREVCEMLLARGADPRKTPGGGLVSEMAFSDVGYLRRMVALGANVQLRRLLPARIY